MKLRVVPASQGLQWVKNGIAVCARQPWGFLSLLGLVVTGTILLSALPLIGAVVIVGAIEAATAIAPAGATALASPKSRTLTFPSMEALMFCGLRSRWTMPFWWA
mgnify:CR=1 FL=1